MRMKFLILGTFLTLRETVNVDTYNGMEGVDIQGADIIIMVGGTLPQSIRIIPSLTLSDKVLANYNLI